MSIPTNSWDICDTCDNSEDMSLEGFKYCLKHNRAVDGFGHCDQYNLPLGHCNQYTLHTLPLGVEQSGPQSSQEADVIKYILDKYSGFITGSAACDVTYKHSDVDIVIKRTKFNAKEFEQYVKDIGWRVPTQRSSAGGYKICNKEYSSTIDVIVLDDKKYNLWYLATNVMLLLIRHSSMFKESIKFKVKRIGFFEGIIVLLRLVGV